MSESLEKGQIITADMLNNIVGDSSTYTFKAGELLTASKLNTIAEAIEDKDEEIAELEGQVEELQAIIDAFPTIESLNVTQNGVYQEAGKAYTPVDVSVSSVTVEALNVTQNGTYSEAGKAYSPVTVNIPTGLSLLDQDMTALSISNNTSVDISVFALAAYTPNNEVVPAYPNGTTPGIIPSANAATLMTFSRPTKLVACGGSSYQNAIYLFVRFLDSAGQVNVSKSGDVSSVTGLGMIGVYGMNVYRVILNSTFRNGTVTFTN